TPKGWRGLLAYESPLRLDALRLTAALARHLPRFAKEARKGGDKFILLMQASRSLNMDNDFPLFLTEYHHA
ncbi:hypothetical protein, partial [Asticcacaulis taihuensis]|uniref:hypothetical protein n=1 Tax=Asticcacaulis taihuensis TaxID=260084 RepID=UPI0039E88545